MLNISVVLSCFANVDPFALMEEMPSPEVKFQKKRILSKPRKIKKPNFVPDFNQKKQIKKTVNKIKEDFDKLTPKTVNKLYKNLSRPLVEKATDSLKLAASTTRKFKRPSRLILKKTNNLSNSIEELKKFLAPEKLLTSFSENLANTQTEFAKLEKEKKEKEKQDQDNQEEKPKEVKGADALFVKIKNLKKKEKWKEIKKLLSKNEEIAATKKGLQYQIEAELNGKKISYSRAKNAASKLLKEDKKNPWGNYAMALYYHNSRKPKPKRVSKYLSLALKAKNPPPGASTLYWTILLKKIWFIPVLLIAGIIGGIVHLKKKKTIVLEEISDQNSDQQETSEAPIEPEIRPEGWKGKLFDIKQKLKPFIDKITQKFQKSKKTEKSAKADNEAQTDNSVNGKNSETAEIASAAEQEQVTESSQSLTDEQTTAPATKENEKTTEEPPADTPEEKTT